MKHNLKIFYLFFLIIFGWDGTYAQNLVPNPSFEIIDTCPNNGGQIQYAPPWNNPTWLASTSPDLFDTCSIYISGYNIPNSEYGNIIPHTGSACAGIVTYNGPTFEPREYIQVKLLDTLTAGKKYCVKFYVWLAFNAQWAAYNFGAYFSKTKIDTSTYFYLPYVPQIINPSSNPLSTKGIWIEISGNFTASGGEKYIVIGNFNNNANTSAIFLGGASWCTWSFYFIDDVSLTLCDYVDINEQLLEKTIKIYPIPSSGEFYIDVSGIDIYEILLYNMFGSSMNINFIKENNLYTIKPYKDAEGIYFLKLKTSKGVITRKIIITK